MEYNGHICSWVGLQDPLVTGGALPVADNEE